jgi:hypothetical protein
VAPQITQTSCTEQGVAGSMEQDVSVRVALQASLIWDIYAAENQRSAINQPMRIVAKSYSNHILGSKFKDKSNSQFVN